MTERKTKDMAPNFFETNSPERMRLFQVFYILVSAVSVIPAVFLFISTYRLYHEKDIARTIQSKQFTDKTSMTLLNLLMLFYPIIIMLYPFPPTDIVEWFFVRKTKRHTNKVKLSCSDKEYLNQIKERPQMFQYNRKRFDDIRRIMSFHTNTDFKFTLFIIIFFYQILMMMIFCGAITWKVILTHRVLKNLLLVQMIYLAAFVLIMVHRIIAGSYIVAFLPLTAERKLTGKEVVGLIDLQHFARQYHISRG